MTEVQKSEEKNSDKIMFIATTTPESDVIATASVVSLACEIEIRAGELLRTNEKVCFRITIRGLKKVMNFTFSRESNVRESINDALRFISVQDVCAIFNNEESVVRKSILAKKIKARKNLTGRAWNVYFDSAISFYATKKRRTKKNEQS